MIDSKVMPTQDEIVARIEARTQNDIFGFEVSDYVYALDYDHAKPHLQDGVTREQWTPSYRNRDEVLKEMREYMPFAWDKATGERGLSALRSIRHMVAWTWLAGDTDFSNEIDNARDSGYGKTILERIGAYYGWDAAEWKGER